MRFLIKLLLASFPPPTPFQGNHPECEARKSQHFFSRGKRLLIHEFVPEGLKQVFIFQEAQGVTRKVYHLPHLYWHGVKKVCRGTKALPSCKGGWGEDQQLNHLLFLEYKEGSLCCCCCCFGFLKPTLCSICAQPAKLSGTQSVTGISPA